MSKQKVLTVVEGDLTSLFVSLEGFEIGMAYDGDSTYQSTNMLNIDGALNLVFHGRGIAFAKWKITITLNDGNEPLFKKSGQLTLDNESILKEAITVPADAGDNAGELPAAATKKRPRSRRGRGAAGNRRAKEVKADKERRKR